MPTKKTVKTTQKKPTAPAKSAIKTPTKAPAKPMAKTVAKPAVKIAPASVKKPTAPVKKAVAPVKKPAVEKKAPIVKKTVKKVVKKTAPIQQAMPTTACYEIKKGDCCKVCSVLRKMVDYYIGCFKKYAVLSGRASRAEFLSFAVINTLISYVLAYCINPYSAFYLIAILYSIVSFAPLSAVATRRAHDCGRSGWHLLSAIAIMLLAMFDFMIAILFFPYDTLTQMGLFAIIMISVFYLLYIFLLQGDENKNIYDTKKSNPLIAGIILVIVAIIPYALPVFLFYAANSVDIGVLPLR